SATTARALETRELTVVVDMFLTDTAQCAHVVLPTTSLLEDDDLLGSYGHHYVGVSKPVIPRPDYARSDLEIVQALAERVGLGEALAGDARAWKRRILAGVLAPHGITLEELESNGPMKHPLAADVVFEGRTFPTPSGRANLLSEDAPEPARPTADFPLVLLSVSAEKA